jgi:hypothetical protein
MISYIRIGREGDRTTWKINSAVRGGERSRESEQVAGQSSVRIQSGWETRYPSEMALT